MKKKILVIDDSPFFLKVLSDLLEEDFFVEKAASAEEAIAMLQASDSKTPSRTLPFDLVITDLNMPGLSGYDVSGFIKGQNRERKFTPVIMLTEMEITKEEARKHGCAAYISKKNLQKVVSIARILLKGSE